jgi:hypothetical protein
MLNRYHEKIALNILQLLAHYQKPWRHIGPYEALHQDMIVAGVFKVAESLSACYAV